MKKQYPSIYKFTSWEDAMKHVAEEHGIAGHLVSRDPNQAPIMWHEFAHTAPDMGMGTWEHEHDDTTPESVRAKMDEALKQVPQMIANLTPEQVEDLKHRTNEFYEGLE